MEERKANIIFAKNGQGYTTNRVTLPVPWIKALGVTEDQREVKITLKDNKIILEKL
ncbi:MAG: AbrB/MazE/SpoVT family DNA-binding domain-containing protein [Ezakiella sp.]|nr:AbrB/MazE/SpoVT family DNA-binding domain-containing protein [Bacillota bacterium]MDY3947721.1 AbrB/MazE/SpoVT family DNA-binding domain-containing protein [Ezakiella sp.]